MMAILAAVAVIGLFAVLVQRQQDRSAAKEHAELYALDKQYSEARYQHVLRQPGDGAFIPFKRPDGWHPGSPMPWGPRQYAPDPNR